MKYGKKIIFATFLLTLFTPIIISSILNIKAKPLGGVFVPVEKPILTDSTWFNGDFQRQQEIYLNENIGLRTTLIKINNQIDFSLFSKNSSEKIIIGKENYLFENNYIDATTGKDFIGDNKIQKFISQAIDAQNILEANEIKMLFVFAPGKASFFEEYIPDKYLSDNKNPTTNYSRLIVECDKNKINFIDFNAWFLNMKDTSSYPLFPKGGIHWSQYGMYLCADSLVKKVESDLKQDLPDISLVNLEVSKEQKHPEYDIGHMLNLLFTIETYELAYPSYTYNQKDKYRPNTLVIGDSFYWNMYYSGIPSNVFKSLEFWYYNSQYYNDGTSTAVGNVQNMNFMEEILKYEYIIILQTDGGLNNFGFGFFNKLIEAEKYGDTNPKLEEYKNKIRNDQKWLDAIQIKAKERGISLEEMIDIDARYMLKQEDR